MARIRVTLDGATDKNGSPLMMHNERLADPLDPYTRYLAEITGKRKKTERDHEEAGRREFLGGGYWAIDEGPEGKHGDPFIPAWNVIRCIQFAARMHKLGRQIERGLVPIDEQLVLQYDGPKDAEAMWKAGTFHTRKGVGVGQSKVIRTRPTFDNWKIEAELELDLRMLDVDVLNLLVLEAGRYIGLGDNRPRFGRFEGGAVLLSDPAEYNIVDLVDEAVAKMATKTAKAAIEADDKKHAVKNPNGKVRKQSVVAKVSSKK